MTKVEALKALSEGVTLTHEYFSANEWVRLHHDGFHYEFEDGVICKPMMFWADRQGIGFENGWSIYSLNNTTNEDRRKD